MKKEDLNIIKEHYDFREFKLNVDALPFNSMVQCATICFNKSWKQWEYTGRVVQVRKEAKHGMDLFFIRRCDGSLYSFYNEGVFPLNEKGTEYCEMFFKDIPLDEPNKEYSINNKLKATGYIIPKEVVSEKSCSYCNKTVREQKKGCVEISCYRQYLPKKALHSDISSKANKQQSTIAESTKEKGN